MKDIVEMAREAGFESNGPIVVVRHSNGSWIGVTKEIERLISIVRADEREDCAKAADDQWVRNPNVSGGDDIRAR